MGRDCGQAAAAGEVEARRVGGCNKQCCPPGASHAAVAAASDTEEEGKKMSMWIASSGRGGLDPTPK